jgi:hypothetical protein
VPEPLFVQTAESDYRPSTASRGPWDPDLLHGGPVAALLAHVLCDATSGGSWFPARLTVDLMRPVPLSTLTVRPTVLRAGRKAQLLSAECLIGDVLVARATLQLIAARDVSIPTDSPGRRWSALGTATAPESLPRIIPASAVGDVAFHASSVTHHSADQILSGGGAAVDWIRVDAELLDGTPLSPFERVVCAADFTNGISSAVPFEEFTFVNADLTVCVFRLPTDEWVQVDAVSHVGDDGVGLAESRLLDRVGLIGHACQSLVVSAR